MSITAWDHVDWTLVDKRVSRIQRRIYKASKEGNRKKVHALQMRLITSLDGKYLAVRRVTTENKGRNTPGVDRQVYVSAKSKTELVQHLRLDGKALPIRRVYIPKPGKTEKRPLGIPIILDRAKQALVKMALEPEWEAIFESDSYGFRPGRGCHDAIMAIFASLRGRSRYVLDADISKCFDRIDHTKLLAKIQTIPNIEKQIHSWLKADIMIGYMDKFDAVEASICGTPQGGVISPLLANIALHGMQEDLKTWYAEEWYPNQPDADRRIAMRDRKTQIALIRYADDFVIIGKSRELIVEAKQFISDWLDKTVGLVLSEEKTSIKNSTEGFDFLGFSIISVQVGTRYRLKYHPSRSSRQRLIANVRQTVQTNKSASAYNLIQLLAPKIIGWGNYFCISECQRDFSVLDSIIHGQIRAWVFRRRSRNLRSRTKLKLKYFPEGKSYVFQGRTYSNNWVLVGSITDPKTGSMKEKFLPKLSWIASKQHVKVQGQASPYDGNHSYWAIRMEKYSGYNRTIRQLLQRQNGYCTWCGEPFGILDRIEVDHIIPKSRNGSDHLDNLQALHKHCHINKSSKEVSRP